jgi:hypothetical protein
MSNGLPKYCLRVTFDILLDDREDALPIAGAFQAIGAQIACDTGRPVAVAGDILTRAEPPKSASEPAPRTEASPLN